MTHTRRPARRTAWIAIFAVLLAALAPGLADALSSPKKAMPWSEICTVAGPRTAPEALPVSGSGQHDGKVFKHCPLCLNHAGHFALPAAAIDSPRVADSGVRFFSLSADPPAHRPVCAATLPRAPPAVA